MQNITSEQKELLDRLRDRDPELMVEWDELRGVAASLRGKLAQPSDEMPDAEKTASEFLDEYVALFGPEDLQDMLRPLSKRKDDLDWTLTKSPTEPKAVTYVYFFGLLIALQGEVCAPRIGSLANFSVMAVAGSMSAAIACVSSQRTQHMLPNFPEDAQRHDLGNHGDHDPHRE